ncbi:hypothetical protein SteCoe_29927 [Stentor coeruleus]|uniref:EF-hand domain-containing protein n=1 Tax=Stentor coeruleus TaxID=5963 RepID=A0A1R2B4T9_9CILI|nr:hypothetical protein SteCoe_29927 [Stentor coeruleus]
MLGDTQIIDDKNSTLNNRPSSFNTLEISRPVLKRKGQNSVKVLPRVMRGSHIGEFDKDLLLRIKPKQVLIEKEQLFQENMELKLKTHSLQQELLRLKTKNMQIENELSKKEDPKDIKQAWDKPQSTSIIPSLKQTIKELKAELEIREKDIFKLKSNIKCSRVSELEVEVQAYIDECTRLRHHLEETLKSKQEPTEEKILTAQALASLKNENNEYFQQISALKTENSTLKATLEEEKKKKKPIVKKVDVNNRTEIHKLRIALDSSSKDFADKEEKYKMEIALLKAKVDKGNIKPKRIGNIVNFKPKAPSLFKLVNSIIPLRFKSVNEFVGIFKNVKSFAGIYEQFKAVCGKVKQKHVSEISIIFNLDRPEKFPDVVKEWYPFYDYSSKYESSDEEDKVKRGKQDTRGIENSKSSSQIIEKPDSSLSKAAKSRESTPALIQKPQEKLESNKNKAPKPGPIANLFIKPKIQTIKKSQVADLLLKSSLALQIHRIAKEDFPNLISNSDSISFEAMEAFFRSEPFSFPQEDARLLSKFLIEPNEDTVDEDLHLASLDHITTKYFKNTENWTILSNTDEERLDKELTSILSEYHLALKESCLACDPDQKGTVSSDDFKIILEDLQLTFTPELHSYCRLLFYSCNMQINQVPYEYFIKSYISHDNSNSQDMSDEEIAVIVRGYLEKIADKMVEDGKTVKGIFNYDDEGLISGQGFCEGLENIGITDIPQDHMVLILEALQYENSEDPCILVEELEDILQHYGVGEHHESMTTEGIAKENQDEDDEYSEDYED